MRLYLEKTLQKTGLVEWLKVLERLPSKLEVQTLNSNPRTGRKEGRQAFSYI
jgi:hypothetical protein